MNPDRHRASQSRDPPGFLNDLHTVHRIQHTKTVRHSVCEIPNCPFHKARNEKNTDIARSISTTQAKKKNANPTLCLEPKLYRVRRLFTDR